jgi:hypothetical protein
MAAPAPNWLQQVPTMAPYMMTAKGPSRIPIPFPCIFTPHILGCGLELDPSRRKPTNRIGGKPGMVGPSWPPWFRELRRAPRLPYHHNPQKEKKFNAMLLLLLL